LHQQQVSQFKRIQAAVGMVRPGSLVSMPDVAVWLVNATPSSTPRSKTNIQILAICWIKQAVKSAKFNELISVHSHKTARGKQSMTSLLMLRIEIPTVKAVLKLQAGRTTGNLPSFPIIAPC